MAPPAPKQPVGGLIPEFDPLGVMETAVPAPAPRPIQPIQIQESQEQVLEEQQREQDKLDYLERVTPASGVGEFVPETFEEQMNLLQGRSGSVFEAGFQGGFLGALLDQDILLPSARDQIDAEVAAYSDRNPWTSLGLNMAGRFASDLPIDLALHFATGGAGLYIDSIAGVAKVGSISRKLVDKRRKLQKMYNEGSFSKRRALGLSQDILEGFAAGTLAEYARTAMGRGGDLNSAIQAGLTDAAVGGALGFAFRSIGDIVKGRGEKFNEQEVIDRVTDSVMEELAPDGKAISNINSQLGFDPNTLEPKLAQILWGEVPIERRTIQHKGQTYEVQQGGELHKVKLLEGFTAPDLSTRSDTVLKVAADADSYLGGLSKAELRRVKQESDKLQTEYDAVRLAAKEDERILLANNLDPIEIEASRAVADALNVRREDIEAAKIEANKERLKEVITENNNLNREINSREKELQRIEDETKSAIESPAFKKEERKLPDETAAQQKARVKKEVAAAVKKESEYSKVVDDSTPEADIPLRLTEFFGRYLNKADRKFASALTKVFEGRARAAGLTLREYLKLKKLAFIDGEGKPSTIFEESATIIRAVKGQTELREFLHEIGHIMRSDLKTLNSKELVALERRYGVKDGIWTREQEEQWAEEFVRSLVHMTDHVSGNVKTPDVPDLPADIANAFKKMANWLWNSLQALYIRVAKTPLQNDVMNLTSQLFDPKRKAHEQTKSLEASVLATREQEGTTQLFDEKADLGGAVDVERVVEVQGELDEIYKDAIGDDVAKNIDGGALVPKTGAISKLVKWADKNPFFSWDNMDLNIITQMLGGSFRRVHAMGVEAANISGELLSTMMGVYEKGINKIPLADRIALKEKKDVYLVTSDGTKQKLKLNGHERIKLTQYARDGRNRENDEITSKAAAKALTTDGLRINGVTYVLQPEEVKLISEGKLLSKSEKAILEVIESTYQSISTRANDIGQGLIGRDIFALDNQFYTPKQTIKTKDHVSETDLAFDKAFDPRSRDGMQGAVMERTGHGTLVLTNPITELERYMSDMSHNLGHVKYHHVLDTLLGEGDVAVQLTEKVGQNFIQSARKLLTVSKGDRKPLGRSKSSFLNTMFSLRQLGILSLNPSPAMKQTGSGFSAAATGKLDWTGKQITAQLLRYAKDPKGLKAKIKEMKAKSPAYAGREVEMSRMFDVDEIGSSGAHLVLGDKLDSKTLLELAGKGDLKLSEATVKMLDKGMFGIRFFDQVTMAAVWDASKAKARNEIKKGSISAKDLDAETNRIFTEVIMESQPTRTGTTLSFNQQAGGLAARALTQFSTQTRKNAFLAFRHVLNYYNIPKDQRPPISSLMSTLAPLMYQTAMIAAIGAFTTWATNDVLMRQLETDSDQRMKDRAKRMNERSHEFALKTFENLLVTAFGQVPVSGSLLAGAFSAATGGRVYDQSIPVFQEIMGAMQGGSEVMAGVFDRRGPQFDEKGAAKLVQEMLRLSGMPSLGNKAVKTLID